MGVRKEWWSEGFWLSDSERRFTQGCWVQGGACPHTQMGKPSCFTHGMIHWVLMKARTKRKAKSVLGLCNRRSRDLSALASNKRNGLGETGHSYSQEVQAIFLFYAVFWNPAIHGQDLMHHWPREVQKKALRWHLRLCPDGHGDCGGR